MTATSISSSPKHDDLSSCYPPLSTSPLLLDTPKIRKKVVIVQSATAIETISASLHPPNTVKTSHSPCSSSVSSTYEYNSEDSDASSASSNHVQSPQTRVPLKKTRRIACPVCRKKFIRRDAFRQHQFKAHGLLPIACEEDGKIAVNTSPWEKLQVGLD